MKRILAIIIALTVAVLPALAQTKAEGQLVKQSVDRVQRVPNDRAQRVRIDRTQQVHLDKDREHKDLEPMNLAKPPKDTLKAAPQAAADTVKADAKADSLSIDSPVIADLPDDFATLDTMPHPKKYHSRHMIGVKYSYDMFKVSANPTIGESYTNHPVNFGVMYTYYHALWDHINLFGLQMGARYCHVGYKSEYPAWGEKVTEVQALLGTQMHIDIKERCRILINAGSFYGYKLSTDKSGGFDANDIRHDYGVYGGAGFAVVFGRFDIHLEANYQFSLCSMYHTYKYSDLYWLTAYPRNLTISVGLYYNLW